MPRAPLAVLLLLSLTAVTAPAAARVPPADGAEPSAAGPRPAQRLAPGRFLVASESMPDPRFERTVILIVSHTEEGTVGLVLNRPTELQLADAAPYLAGVDGTDHRLYVGGPVAIGTILFLARGAPEPHGSADEMVGVMDGVYAGGNRDTLESLIAAAVPARGLRVFLGHAGWSPGQLGAELAEGSWQLFRAAPRVALDEPSESLWDYFMGTATPRGLLVLSPRRTGAGEAKGPRR